MLIYLTRYKEVPILTEDRPVEKSRLDFIIEIGGEIFKATAKIVHEEALTCHLCRKMCYQNARLFELIELIKARGEHPFEAEGIAGEHAKAEIEKRLANSSLETHNCPYGEHPEGTFSSFECEVNQSIS